MKRLNMFPFFMSIALVNILCFSFWSIFLTISLIKMLYRKINLANERSCLKKLFELVIVRCG